MEYSEVVKLLAPCGMDCSRCADYVNGDIRRLSNELLERLGNYEPVARMKCRGNPAFEGYAQFADILKSLATGACSGCRGDNVLCPITTCSAKECHKEKGVDFCCQCNEYPCERQFEGRLRDRWRSINDRMKQIGIVEYYIEQSRLPRY